MNHKVLQLLLYRSKLQRIFLKQPLSNDRGYFFSFIILSPLPNCTCIMPIFYSSLFFYLNESKHHKSFSFRYKDCCLILSSNNVNCLTINTDYVNFKCTQFLFNIYLFFDSHRNIEPFVQQYKVCLFFSFVWHIII